MSSESKVELGPESLRLDNLLSKHIDDKSRKSMWGTVDKVLNQCIDSIGNELGSTGVVLGYVQSGKTTAITSLIAKAADSGVQIIISLLGTTNLLLEQNSGRISQSLGIGTRNDYRWVEITNPSSKSDGVEIAEWLSRGRCIFIPVLKHSGRINSLSKILMDQGLAGTSVLVIDDEADQSSLNTAIKSGGESRTYESIKNLRGCIPKHCYVQFTATPYAILMLGDEDHLFPDFIEFLEPGTGYTGGREFFVNNYDTVIRTIPLGDEQGSKAPIDLPRSLKNSLATFFVGASYLLAQNVDNAPISMLVHPSAKTTIQERYRYLLTRYISDLSDKFAVVESLDDLPLEFRDEISRLGVNDRSMIQVEQLISSLKNSLKESKIWVLNSTTTISRVDWNISPVHILVGGNKLDRGFTVEGLTVTYMNRKPSEQIDTLEQRARAFGYRGDQLSYCQFFASHRTVKILRDVVYTEYDLRGRLQDHIAAGGTVDSWAREIGLLVPSGTKPTRSSVVRALSTTSPGWHSLRRPSYDADSIASNRQLVEGLGLYSAPKVSQGRLEFRTIYLPIDELIAHLFENWATDSYSPDWRRDDIMSVLQFSSRHPLRDQLVPVMLMEDDGRARTRKWDAETGFVNLFQGRDVNPKPGQDFYPGDRNIEDLESEPDKIVVQVHRLVRTEIPNDLEVLTLAVHLGERPIIRANSTKHIVESEIL